MTEVLEPMPFRASRRQRQYRVSAIHGLDRGLLIGRSADESAVSRVWNTCSSRCSGSIDVGANRFQFRRGLLGGA
jgi:hypothetical protein